MELIEGESPVGSLPLSCALPALSASAADSVIYKIRYFWVLFRIGGSAGEDKGVVPSYRERGSHFWNEQGEMRFGRFRGGKAVGEGGVAGARVRRCSHRAGTGGDAKRISFLGSTACSTAGRDRRSRA